MIYPYNFHCHRLITQVRASCLQNKPIYTSCRILFLLESAPTLNGIEEVSCSTMDSDLIVELGVHDLAAHNFVKCFVSLGSTPDPYHRLIFIRTLSLALGHPAPGPFSIFPTD
jgi:hypothetical protein